MAIWHIGGGSCGWLELLLSDGLDEVWPSGSLEEVCDALRPPDSFAVMQDFCTLLPVHENSLIIRLSYCWSNALTNHPIGGGGGTGNKGFSWIQFGWSTTLFHCHGKINRDPLEWRPGIPIGIPPVHTGTAYACSRCRSIFKKCYSH